MRWNVGQWIRVIRVKVLIMNEVVNPGTAHTPKVFVVCDQSDTAPVWGYILRQQGLNVILETSLEKAIDRWSMEMPDLVVIDIDVAQQDPMELYRKFREVSVAPLCFFCLLIMKHKSSKPTRPVWMRSSSSQSARPSSWPRSWPGYGAVGPCRLTG